MFTFTTDYYIGVFISAMGALQLAASLGGLKGLLFLKSPIVSRTLALTLVVAGFVLFFSTGSRNINDYEGGLDAPTQGLFFFLGAFTAVLVTLALSSLVNYRMRGDESEPSVWCRDPSRHQLRARFGAQHRLLVQELANADETLFLGINGFVGTLPYRGQGGPVGR